MRLWVTWLDTADRGGDRQRGTAAGDLPSVDSATGREQPVRRRLPATALSPSSERHLPLTRWDEEVPHPDSLLTPGCVAAGCAPPGR